MASNISAYFLDPSSAAVKCSLVDQLLHQISIVLDSADLNSLPFDSIVKALSGDERLTPAALTSLLLGIASSLMVVGSVLFMVGAMMMPFVAGMGTVACVGSMLPNFMVPWLWRGRKATKYVQ